MAEVDDFSALAQTLLRSGNVWDNHACMPLRPGDVHFLPQLERVRKAGVNLISLNIIYDVVDLRDA
jgi:membrane dipeptidase